MASPEGNTSRRQRSGTISSITNTVQAAATELLQKDPPPGFFAATADTAAHAPTIGEIRRGSFGSDGWHAEQQIQRRQRTFSQESAKRRSRRVSNEDKEREREVDGGRQLFPALTEERSHVSREEPELNAPMLPPYRKEEEELPIESVDTNHTQTRTDHDRIAPISGDRRVYSSGYIPPPVVPWTTSTAIALKSFGKWFCTPFGFFLTLYGLNVVAWGGMLFLLLCNASPPMCWAPVHSAETEGHMSDAAALRLNDGRLPRYKNCNDINSPRRVWLEIDSQILNALFCVTGLGLIPWRFRDFYYLCLWRFTSERRSGKAAKLYGLRMLAGIYKNWVRLPDSHTLDQVSTAQYQRRLAKETSASSPVSDDAVDLELGSEAINDLRLPLPLAKAPLAPLTGIRAPPTALWKIDFFVWSQVLNTVFQVVLCGFMWGMSRYNRPSWSTGLFIALACIIAGLGGWVSYVEGKKIKRVEGVRAAGLPDVSGEEGVPLEQTPTGGTGHESLHLDAKNVKR
ncbi:hypothetical protein LTR10_008150 [Elasticomyces elasticus]|uniref:Uncharacterized protein n=1 Tax=Elasticomyces elasticus TaxID=574655 RepID=A0AAN7W755_9PEZI|nr:hypothetical protein LTR10_008150 [Elasticomyces elasticus]KAK4971999.1 hypothetical protein LTR42_006504 [Elasticomyces elasticus]KAK5701045.1 hypothetical protein LTR97_005564 [Elasticomyces elasticus]